MMKGVLWNNRAWQWFMAFVCPTWLWRAGMWLRFDFKYWVRGIPIEDACDFCPACQKIAADKGADNA